METVEGWPGPGGAGLCVAPELITFVYHKTREEATTLCHTNEDPTDFIWYETRDNLLMILQLEGVRTRDTAPGQRTPAVFADLRWVVVRV